MKKFKSATKNKGTTIILEDCQDAIDRTESVIFSKKEFISKIWPYKQESDITYQYNGLLERWKICKDAIQKGNKDLKTLSEEITENILNIVDDIQPIFSQQKQGYIRTDGEQGIATSAELLMQGEELCAFKRKNSEEKKVKKGSGEGSYRILINTDVSWWGKPEMNCALVGALILLLQRYAPVEVWIQQGWLGSSKNDGVTLFKLDFTAAVDITSLAFWICHPYKDNPFSWLVNKALGREETATSCVAEIECDIMLRGDWFIKEGVSYHSLNSMTPFEQTDMIAKWIASTGYKILYNEDELPPEIKDI